MVRMRDVSNVDTVGEFKIRNIYLDENMIVCPLSEDLSTSESDRSYQRVNIDRPYYRVCYDFIQDNLVGAIVTKGVGKALTVPYLVQVLDACGIGLLAWITADDYIGEDISYYTDPDLLNAKQIVKGHELNKFFPNMEDSFIESIVKLIQEGVDSKSIAQPIVGFKPLDVVPSRACDIVKRTILSSRVRTICNRKNVRPKFIYDGGKIPHVLPIAHYKYGHRNDQHVRSSIYMMDNDNIETIVNLSEYVGLLNIPKDWFQSVLYTLPDNLKQVVHVVHRPFIGKTCTESRGTIMTVYTC